MSITSYYHSFNSKKADKVWEEEFDKLADNISDDQKNYDALKEKVWRTEFELGKELDKMIMDKYTQGEFSPDAEQRRADEKKGMEDIQKKLEPLRQQLKELENKNPLLNLDLGYHIATQTPIDDEAYLEQIMIDADLKFGGRYIDHNEKDVYGYIYLLNILFPDLGIDTESGSDGITKEQWIYIFEHLNDLADKLKSERDSIIRQLDNLIFIGDGFDEYIQDFTEFLRSTKSIVEESKAENTRFLVGVDVSGWEDPELVKRAKKHTELIKNHPLMQKPLENISLG